MGGGIVRIDRAFQEKINVKEFDVVGLEGGRNTSAIVLNGNPSDTGLDIVRMDGLLRTNAKISIGDLISVKKVEWKEASHVTLAPVNKGIHISAPSESLTAVFKNRSVSKGDFISTTSFRKRKPKDTFGTGFMFEDMLQDFLGPSFGLGEIKMQVVSTSPSGIVKITDMTEIELLP